ncbi:MAG: hypothetical protein JWO36_1187 [Myxococcales bacterium]|nr:hypothetical protein [Myxococcales bacterium]
MRNAILVGILVLASGCMGTIDGTGGPIGGPGGGNGSPDAGAGSGSGTPTDGGGGAGDGSSAAACKTKVVSGIGSGQHNPGQDCQQGCHNHGFILSGTLFSAINGNTPLVGATVTVTDAANHTFDMVTQQNGNFYLKTAVTFPVKVVASSCPDTTPMSGTIAAGNGGCNKGGCHAAGATGVIHLP